MHWHQHVPVRLLLPGRANPRRRIVRIRLDHNAFGRNRFQRVLKELHVERDLQLLSLHGCIDLDFALARFCRGGQQLHFTAMIRARLQVEANHVAPFSGDSPCFPAIF